MKTQIINTRGGIIGLVVFSMLFLVSNQRTKTETEHSTSLYQTLDRPMKRDRIDLAMQQEFEMTKDPNTQEIPKNKLKSALKHFDKLAGENLLKSSKQWVERGPSNMGGRTRALLFDKNDNSGKTVFAGSVSGGLWRCEDIMAAPANVKWTQLNEQLDNLSVTTIAQNEANPLQMIFGTGEGYFGESGIKGIGLYKSMDGGDSWSHISATNTEEFEYIQKVAITTEGHYYVATAKAGLQVSKDGGETWEKSLGKNKYAGSNQVSDFEIIDQNSYIAALGLQEKDGIYITHDAGRTWFKSTTGLAASNYKRIEVAVAQSNVNVIYSIFQSATTNGVYGIYKSTNQGRSWVKTNSPNAVGMSDFTRGQAWYNLSIDVDPSDESNLIVGGIDLHKSNNSGNAWIQISQWEGKENIQYVHADQHQILFDDRFPNRVLIGNDGGVYFSEQSNLAKPNFISKNNGYNVAQLYSVAIHPESEKNYFLTGTQDNGTLLYQQSGVNATVDVGGGDGGFCFIDNQNPEIQIITNTFNNFQVSTNGGKSFIKRFFGNTGSFINPTDYDHLNKKLYSAFSPGRLLRYENVSLGGYSYELPAVAGVTDHFSFIKVVNVNSKDWLYVGTVQGDIYKIENPSKGTYLIGQKIRKGAGEYVSGISINESNPDQIIVSFSNYGVNSVISTTNGGRSWQSVEGSLPDMPVRWVIQDKVDADRFYLATELGVWETAKLNGSSTNWRPSKGTPKVRVDMIKQRASDDALFAATHGRGLFSLEDGVDVPEDEIVVDLNFEIPTHSFSINESAIEQDETACNAANYTLSIPIKVNILGDDNEINIKVLEAQSSATEGIDFDITSKNIILTEDAFIDVQIYNDEILEDQENITLTISSDLQNYEVEIKIEDDEFMPSLVETNNIGGTYTLGISNSTSNYAPFRGYYEDEKTQLIILASELIEAGLNTGDIHELSLEVSDKKSDSDFDYKSFSISLAHSSITNFTANNLDFENDLEMVYSQTIKTNIGENKFTFDTPFAWDGKSNLMVQFCFDNDNWNKDDYVKMVASDHYSMIERYSDNTIGCDMTRASKVFNYRPLITLHQTAQVPQASAEFEVGLRYFTNKSYLATGETAIFKNQYDQYIGIIENNEEGDLGCSALGILQKGSNSTLSLGNYSRTKKYFFADLENEADYNLKFFYRDSEVENLDLTRADLIYSPYKMTKSGQDDLEVIGLDDWSGTWLNSEVYMVELKSEYRSGSFCLATNQSGSATTDENISAKSADSKDESIFNIHLFPNPTEQVINFDIKTEISTTGYKIYNMKGEEMSNLEIVAHNNRGTIYLGDIPSGLYLFEVIRSDGKVLIGKFNKA